jgi:uncharacterized iron-regulated protein
VLRARAPFRGVRSTDGAELDQRAVLEAIVAADLVCVGEQHDDPAQHFVQLAIVERALDRAPQTGRRLAVGLEMLPREHQAALDRFARGELDEAAFLDAVTWSKTWGFDFNLYRPVLEAALRGGAELIALNASQQIAHTVARNGLVGLSDEERRALPELVLDDTEHRQIFDRAMAEHPDMKMSPDDLYAAQVLWDETMADTAARWLAQGGAPRQLVVLAGAGHCHESAIVRRVERRIEVDAVSVRTRPSGESPQEDDAAVDYEILLSPPNVPATP